MKHDPIVAAVRRRDFIDALCGSLTAVALWSILGAIAALMLDAPDVAWDFVWSLLGSGVTLVVIGLYRGRSA